MTQTKLLKNGRKNKMIEQYQQLLPMIHDALLGKATVALFNREHYIEVKNGSLISLPAQAGDTIKEGSSAYQVIQTGEHVATEVGPEVLGVAYYALTYPIKNSNGEIIGGMALAISAEMLHASQKLQDTAHELASSMEQISAAIETIAMSAQELSSAGQNMAMSSQNVIQRAEEMEEVVEYIDSVARDTKLLGLNASIEAARAGEMGRGFGVVASEIRTMAVSSADSAKNIRKIIRGIHGLIEEMTIDINKSSGNTQEVSASIQEIGASIESLTQTAENLEKMAQKL